MQVAKAGKLQKFFIYISPELNTIRMFAISLDLLTNSLPVEAHS